MNNSNEAKGGVENTTMIILTFMAIVGLLFALVFFFKAIHAISKPRPDTIQAQLTDALSPTIVALSLKDGEYNVTFNQISYMEASKGQMGVQFIDEPCGARQPEVKLQVVKGSLAAVKTSDVLLATVDKATAVDCITRSLRKITPQLYESLADAQRADAQEHQQIEKAKKSWSQ